MAWLTAVALKIGLGGALGKMAAALLGSLGVGGAWMLARRILPGLAAKAVGAELKHLLSPENPEDRALVVALMRWAEVKHGKGAGMAKFTVVKEKVKAIFRLSDAQAAELDQVLNDIFAAAKAEVEKSVGG